MLTPLAALLILGLFALFATGDGVFTFGGPTGEVHDGVALVDGFVGFLYADPAHPHFRELLNLALCFGVLVIFATVVTATAITSTDEANGITRLAVA